VTAAVTSGLSTTSEESTNKNIIVPTRLRPTDKRLRKIHSINSSHTTHEKSINFNWREKKNFKVISFGLEKTIEVEKMPILEKQPMAVYRNKMGQFTSTYRQVKSTNTVS
jgi:hypothetical protein